MEREWSSGFLKYDEFNRGRIKEERTAIWG